MNVWNTTNEGGAMKRSWRVSVIVLVFALVAAACTGGDEDGNDEPSERRDRW